MRYRQVFYLAVFLLIFSMITGCAADEAEQSDEIVDEAKQVTAEEEPEEGENDNIELTAYAEEIGFYLTSQVRDNFNANTALILERTITETKALTGDHLWVVFTAEEETAAFHDKEFSYYVKIEDGTFSRELNLHQ